MVKILQILLMTAIFASIHRRLVRLLSIYLFIQRSRCCDPPLVQTSAIKEFIRMHFYVSRGKNDPA